ncbi:hypothetical protein [Marinomonas transparens]|uniref:Phage protein n=1 Tax=Marinomonas transparens TaxID=2795388 RepID=A0A934JQL8_9GAMM|nr:hypothetical protein [Marinomonas transparens]MBJ7536597.1 hypothetical protein [Marinomonas transparens]
MAGLKVRCISTKPYLDEGQNGQLMEGQFEGEMVSLTINGVYEVLDEDDEYYRIIDNTDDDYLYPKVMFETVAP